MDPDPDTINQSRSSTLVILYTQVFSTYQQVYWPGLPLCGDCLAPPRHRERVLPLRPGRAGAQHPVSPRLVYPATQGTRYQWDDRQATVQYSTVQYSTVQYSTVNINQSYLQKHTPSLIDVHFMIFPLASTDCRSFPWWSPS